MMSSPSAPSRRRPSALLLVLLLLLTPAVPLFEGLAPSASAAGVARHVYEFSDGSSEYVALYQGANPDTGATIRLPKGAEVVDVSFTLSGASSTGWSSTATSTTDEMACR